MPNEELQDLRYKLQRRVRRLNGLGHQLFHLVLRQVWGFVESNQVLMGVLDELEHREPLAEHEASLICGGQARAGESEDENAAICMHVIRNCVRNDTAKMPEVAIGSRYGGGGEFDESVQCFCTTFVEPLYDYLDEHLDDQRAILATLVRFKHRCEWFHRERVHALWEQDQGHGEGRLSKELYEYLYEHGVEFVVEPQSVSGRADFVSPDSAKEPLVADVKIFSPDKGKGKPYLVSAFAQVYQYALDHNHPFGFLVIFNTSGKDLNLVFAHQNDTVPFVTHNHKTVFFVVIDVFPYGASASKRGKLASIQLLEEELVTALAE